MFGLQLQDVLIILIVALLLFGPNRLPQISRGLGTAFREFRDALSDEAKQDDEKKNETPSPSNHQ